MLSADAFLTPEGRLDQRVLWPRLSSNAVYDLLQGFITDAYHQAGMDEIAPGAERDAIAAQWVYYRAYDNVHDRLLINPSSVGLGDQGTAGWLLTQIQDVETKALQALESFTLMLGGALGGGDVALTPVTRESAFVATTISFAPSYSLNGDA
jgi:hypothetical protein